MMILEKRAWRPEAGPFSGSGSSGKVLLDPRRLRKRRVRGPMLFQLQGITKTYGRVTALRDLAVSVPESGAIGLLGPNGAGKTTMIRTLLGLIRIDAGQGQVL